ncbi:bifunctional DnaQ family exonuclease/ATP-dependent helicase [Streptococcus ferus]|uniref:bifunctional DnaQ family exonuclease/ATP-dependent helicase n=1 Tax=Streptococcus ferus TaxID=1345 RepID=UPI0035A0F3F2
MTEKKTRKYAVVDLEATGAHQTASIIQVGIVILENGRVIESYETDVNPHEPLSQHISDLTGITDQQLEKAPDFSQVAAHIFGLISDCVFVAHNVKFDANLLAEHLFLEGYELLTPRVDTVELTQVFYPQFERYNLSSLSEQLELDLSDAHTAIADARATAQLFLKLQDKMARLPKLTLENLLALSDNLLFESHLVIEEAFEAAKPLLEDCFEEVGGIVLRKPKQLLQERRLSADFATNIALLGLDRRKKQEAFASFLEKRIDDGRVSFLEAQAGLGKTFGYLLPLLAQQEGQKQIILSVPTKVLQDQIMANEARKLAQTFHINAHSLKSPRNYLKLDTFYASLKNHEDNRLVNRYKMQLLVWLTETDTGDLDEIQQKQRYAAYFDKLKHDGSLSQTSLFKDVDFWQKSYQRAQQSRLLITNHAYLLTRIEDDQAFVKGKYLVLDEAQKLFLVWEEFTRSQLNMGETLQTISSLLDEDSPILQRRLLESLQFELNHLLEQFHKQVSPQLKANLVQRLRQDVKELDCEQLLDLAKALDERFSLFWFEEEYFEQHRQIYLKSASMDVMDFSAFLPETRKTFLVSATLQMSSQVSLADLLGFKAFTFDSLEKEPSQGQSIWVDQSMPPVDHLDEIEYETQLIQRLSQLYKLHQPTLVLFNSKKTMLAVSDGLDQLHLPHLTQDKNGTAFNVKKRFDREESHFLLGTGSFWEGVDFIQQDKILEVITRLPFDNPEDFMVKKINHFLKKSGKRPFYDYTLPVTILRLKQAIGRTKRRENQKSAVVMLDSRLMKKSYGKIIYKSLSETAHLASQNFDQIMSEIAKFLI